jgi:hypothetical protein
MIFEEEDDPKEELARDIATITYRVDKNGEFYVDIDLEDYTNDTVQKLGYLISSIPSLQFQVQTMDIVRKAFMKDGKKEELERLIATVIVKSEKFLDRLEKQCEEEEEEGQGNEPCIKPSDMI